MCISNDATSQGGVIQRVQQQCTRHFKQTRGDHHALFEKEDDMLLLTTHTSIPTKETKSPKNTHLTYKKSYLRLSESMIRWAFVFVCTISKPAGFVLSYIPEYDDVRRVRNTAAMYHEVHMHTENVQLLLHAEETTRSLQPSMTESTENSVLHNFQRVHFTIQKLIDQCVPYTVHRWCGFALLLTVFLCRIFVTQRWYIICYTLAIYLLNLFIQFLTPKFDPSLEQESKSSTLEEGGEEKHETDEEFRPFIRRLPEFKFWLHGTTATFISISMSLLPVFDIPVFWPILLMYFILLFTLTMRKQVQHMMKYRYLPFDIGKTKYGH